MADSYVPIFFDWPEATRELNDHEKGRLIDAIVLYARGDADFRGVLRKNERFVFPLFQAQIDRSRVDRENGKKGGRPRKRPAVSGESVNPVSEKPGGFENQNPVSESAGGFAGENPGFANNNNNHNHNDDHEYEDEHEHENEGGSGEDEERSIASAGDAGAGARVVSDAWRRHFGNYPNPATARIVAWWARVYGYEDPAMIDEAVQAAAMRNANDPVGYVRALFGDWRRRGVGTTGELE